MAINLNVTPAEIEGEDYANGNSNRAVRVLNIVKVIDALGIDMGYVRFDLGNGHNTYSVESTIMLDWAKLNNCDYYAASREDFNIWEAVSNARQGFYDAVIVEDLS